MRLKESRGVEKSAGRDRATPEMQLLLCCARPQMTEGARQQARELLDRALDWQRLLVLANVHGLRPLLYWHLRDFKEAVPGHVLVKLQHVFMQNAARSLQWTHELAEIIRILAQDGITSIPYKGPALAVRLYGNVALREWCDLDLFVNPADYGTARRLLRERGYRSRHTMPVAAEGFFFERRHSETFVRNEGFVVELHWAFTSRSLGHDPDVDAIFRRLVPLAVVGADMKMLSDADLLLALAAHGAKHLWARLEWLAGLAELMRSMNGSVDWAEVGRTARATHRERVLLVGVRLADELLESTVPDELLERARNDRVVSRLVEDVRRALIEEKALNPDRGRWERLAVEWFKFRTVEGVRDRLRFVIYRATTPRRVDDAKVVGMAGHAVPIAAIVRPARILGKLVRTTWSSEETERSNSEETERNNEKATDASTSGKAMTL